MPPDVRDADALPQGERAGEESGDTGSPVRPDPIADGSQALAHDGYDAQLWDETAATYGRLADAARRHADRLVTAPALLRDLFWSFHQRAPRVAPPVPLTPAHTHNRAIVEQVMGTIEWAATRAAGTIGDPLAAALATVGVAGRVLAALDAATVAAINSSGRSGARRG